MQSTKVASLSLLQDEKYATILCYPKYDSEETMKRIRQLERLGVAAVHFIGGKKALGLSVLGKGHVGIVVIANTKTGQAALKIRRVDADRKRMQHEAEMLAKANTLGIGPRLIGKEKDFLLMEFIDGSLLPDWIACLKGRNARNRIQNVLLDILEQCYKLDQAGLDHGELSRAPKHIIVDTLDKPKIVDFETASVMRRTSNVTSIAQYLFMKSQLAKILCHRLGHIDQKALVAKLRTYKHRSTRQNFDIILETCKLIQ
jgi:putative serine/threonine protein kinase